MMDFTTPTEPEAYYVICIDGRVVAQDGQLLIFATLEDAKKTLTKVWAMEVIIGIDAEIKKIQTNFKPLNFNEEERADLKKAARQLHNSRMRSARKLLDSKEKE